ncbi:hypothetical protein [Chryseobacterium echinoideorum]|uniref:hypothetical protein n=1 Tax=Chryseobacterium echinoideorum TaxID=1549648 RepID=UPI001184B68D|nr:hypothetical protein [Chryseobacterium echinoideorum]
MKEKYPKKLIDWAEKVINLCTPIAQKFNLEYYPLQSKAKLNPDILFIGLNPGGGYGYECQINNPDWEFDKINSRLTADRILNGNPSFDREFLAGKWKYGNGLRKIDFFKNSIDKYDFVFTNYVFYSSRRFSEINKNEFKEAIQENIKLTLELIDIINPKNIIILGTGSGIDQISKKNKLILQGFRKRLLVQGEINGKIVYGIPHPSYNNFSEEDEAISDTLEKLLNGEPIEPFSLSTMHPQKNIIHSKKSNFDTDEFLKHFAKYNPKKHKKWIDINVDGIGNDEILIRINPNYKEFGVRNMQKDKFKTFENEMVYDQFFDNSFDRTNNSWFIRKEFKYFTNLNTEIIEAVEGFLLHIESERK